MDAAIDVLGLRECEHTIVGNALVRGISGGQRKRVTVGEALLSGARVLALDEVTNGLDASTAQTLVQWLTQWAHSTGGTVIAALQAPTPEIVAAFDSVILLSQGHVLYHGPTAAMGGYLASIGFVQPTRTDIADFAIELATSPSMTAELYAHDFALAGGAPIVSTRVVELAAHWKATAAAVGASVKTLADGSSGGGGSSISAEVNAHPLSRAQFSQRQYANSVLMLTRLLLSRQLKLTFRNKAFVIAKLSQCVFMGFIVGEERSIAAGVHQGQRRVQQCIQFIDCIDFSRCASSP